MIRSIHGAGFLSARAQVSLVKALAMVAVRSLFNGGKVDQNALSMYG
jgi:hypothetical protein